MKKLIIIRKESDSMAKEKSGLWVTLYDKDLSIKSISFIPDESDNKWDTSKYKLQGQDEN